MANAICGFIMQKDFKIGIIIGLFVVILIFLWLAALPSSSIFARLRNIQKAQADSALLSKAPVASKSGAPPSVVIEEPAAAGSADVPSQRYHIVMKNQTLSDISRIYYGSPALWTKIRDANPAINPDKVIPGTRLYIPP